MRDRAGNLDYQREVPRCYGTVVFISYLKKGVDADNAGLLVGEMVIAVNNEEPALKLQQKC